LKREIDLTKGSNKKKDQLGKNNISQIEIECENKLKFIKNLSTKIKNLKNNNRS
jgi:hypothetical protein